MADRISSTPGQSLEGQRRDAARQRTRELLTSIGSPIILLILWEIAARTGIVDRRILPPPTIVAVTIMDMFEREHLLQHTWITTVRFAIGMVAGTIPGVLLGLTMGLFRWVRVILNPLVAMLYPVPRIALFPLVLILVGLNESSNIIMIAIG